MHCLLRRSMDVMLTIAAASAGFFKNKSTFKFSG
jgi:hypothetical protein